MGQCLIAYKTNMKAAITQTTSQGIYTIKDYNLHPLIPVSFLFDLLEIVTGPWKHGYSYHRLYRIFNFY